MDAARDEIDTILTTADTEKDILQTQADEEITEATRVKDAKEGFIDLIAAAQETAHQTQMQRIREEQAGWAWPVTPAQEFPTPPLPSDWPVTMMQEGGIIRKPTLALLGESGGEAVVPLGNTTTTGKTEVNINISAGALMGNESEARRFARLIHRYLREEDRTRAVGLSL